MYPRDQQRDPRRSYPPPSPFDTRGAVDHRSRASSMRSTSRQGSRTPRAYQGRDRSASPVRNRSNRSNERPREVNGARHPEPRAAIIRGQGSTEASGQRDQEATGQRGRDAERGNATGGRSTSAGTSSVGRGDEVVTSGNLDPEEVFVMRLMETTRAFEKSKDARDYLSQFKRLRSHSNLTASEAIEVDKSIEDRQRALREAEHNRTQRIVSFKESVRPVLITHGGITVAGGPTGTSGSTDVATSRLKVKAGVADKLERMQLDMENMQSLVLTVEDNSIENHRVNRESIADIEKTARLERLARHKDRTNYKAQRELDIAEFEKVRANDLAEYEKVRANDRAEFEKVRKVQDETIAELQQKVERIAKYAETHVKHNEEMLKKLSGLSSRHLETLGTRKAPE